MPFQSFDEPFNILVLGIGFEKRLKSIMEPSLSEVIVCWLEMLFSLGQPNSIFEQTHEPFPKGFPFIRLIMPIHFDQFREQVIETPLLGQGSDFNRKDYDENKRYQKYRRVLRFQ